MVYFGKLPGERACGDLLEQTPERHVMFGKGLSITQWMVDKALALVRLAGLCWALMMTSLHWFALLSLLILACRDFIGRNIPGNFRWYSNCFMLRPWTCIHQQSLMVSSGSYS